MASFEAVEAEVWSKVKLHFEQVTELPVSERSAYLDSLSVSDPQLSQMVRDLVDASGEASDSLDQPAWIPTPGPEADHRVLSPGQFLADRFEVQEFLGSGGAGEVYRAWDRDRGVAVALKTVRTGMFSGPGALKALTNELNVASRVSHPNICRLFDITVAASGQAGPSFVSMELLEGETLAARIRRGRLSIEEARPIVEQLVAGVSAAHQQGVIHRDLKPGNVMLVKAPGGTRAVITDFGLARENKPEALDQTVQSVGSFAGTPAYMSPEQLRGHRASQASDIHALGVIMFEMVTGKLPFSGESSAVIASKRLSESAPTPSSFVSGLDRRWDRAILACLESEPALRPPNAEAILTLLEERPPLRWPRRVAIAAAITALVAAALIAFAVLRPTPIRHEARVAYDLGKVFSNRRGPDDFRQAIEKFNEAVKLEPNWAEAWAELAVAYAGASNFVISDPREAIQKARIAAGRAVALKPSLGRAQGALARSQSLDLKQWPRAGRAFELALESDPDDADVHQWYAGYLRKNGFFAQAELEAATAMELTHRADPQPWTELGADLFTSGNLAAFHRHAEEQASVFPNEAMSQYMRSRSLEYQGRFDEANAALERARQLGLKPQTLQAQRGLIAATRGDLSKARELANQLKDQAQQVPIDGLLLAGIYAKVGDTDQAFAALDDAYNRYDNTLLSLATSPFLKALHGDPRFTALLRKLNFPDQIMQQIGLSAFSSPFSASQPKSTGTR